VALTPRHWRGNALRVKTGRHAVLLAPTPSIARNTRTHSAVHNQKSYKQGERICAVVARKRGRGVRDAFIYRPRPEKGTILWVWGRTVVQEELPRKMGVLHLAQYFVTLYVHAATAPHLHDTYPYTGKAATMMASGLKKCNIPPWKYTIMSDTMS